jgi:hypothetical protein
MNPQEEDKSALNALEQKLYNPKENMEEISYHHVRDRKEKELPTSWGEDTPIIRESSEDGGLSFGAKFLIGSSILLLLVLLFAGWKIFSSGNLISDRNIEMNLSIDPFIEGGEATPLTVTLNNRNKVPLEMATLTLMYKQGSGAQDEQEKIREKRDLGDVAAGDFRKQQFDVTVYGSEAESRDVTVKLEYKVKGSENHLFSKIVTTQVILKSPPISVRVDGPSVLSIGQSGTFTVSVKNNTSTTTAPSALLVTLPANFKIDSTNPRASARGNIWQIGALAPGASQDVSITGSIFGSQGEVGTIRAQVGSTGGSVSEIGVVYASQIFDISLRASPLQLSLDLRTERGSSDGIRYGDVVQLAVNYKNATSDSLQNAEFALKISGDAALVKQITAPQGYYDSTTGTITWNRATSPELATLAPNAEGSFQVSIPIVTRGTNSPKLSLALVGKGTSANADDVVATLDRSWSVQGSASVSANTSYKNSPFQNTGPIPPQANVETTYTAHIVVSAQNALSNAKVSFTLPAYVSWRNVSSNPNNTTYDTTTRTVTWNIGSIQAGKTVVTDIGLSVKPSQSHVKTSPNITSGIVLEADETESRARLRTTISGLTTYISGENWNVNPSTVIDP